jgi:hypothetical protein
MVYGNSVPTGGAGFVLRVLRNFPVKFQRLQLTTGGSMRHARNMKARNLRTKDELEKPKAQRKPAVTAAGNPKTTDMRLTVDQICEMLEPHRKRLPTLFRWVIELRRADEDRGDRVDLRPLADLLIDAEREMPPPSVLKQLGLFLRRHQGVRRRGKPYSAFSKPKKECLQEAVRLYRDLRSGRAGTISDMTRQLKIEPGESVSLEDWEQLPPSRKLGRDEAIKLIAELKGLDEAELHDAVDGRISSMRR